MEKFNEIKSKFETGFNVIEEEKAEFNLYPEYENIGATPKKVVEHLPFKSKSSFTPRKPLKPPRSTPRQLQTSSTNEYENIEYVRQKPIQVAKIRSTRKKKIKTRRAKPLEILPSINEDFSKLSLSLPEPEYANIVSRNLATEYFLPDNTSSQSILSENVLYPSQDFNQDNYDYVIDNSLYIDFFQRTGQSSTDFSCEAKSLVTSKLKKEDEAFSLKTNLSNKKSTPSISNPFISKKIKKLSEKPTSVLLPLKEDEPIFANITQRNSDGTIEWETWHADEHPPIQSHSESKPKLSKLLPKNLNFWSKPSKKNQDLEETNVLEVKKPFPSL